MFKVLTPTEPAMSEQRHVVCPRCAAINRLPETRLGEQPNCGQCKQPLFQGAPVELTNKTFDRFVERTDLPVVVDFWAEWCGPCHSMAPHFKQATGVLEPRARLAKLNVDESQEIAARYNIRSIPTMVAFRNGREVSRHSGAMDHGSIVKWVRALPE
jgi:thioredoxin 2